MEFAIDFCGCAIVKADTEEQAKELFWDWVEQNQENDKVALEVSSFETGSIEEVED